jgi:hypothetical protein
VSWKAGEHLNPSQFRDVKGFHSVSFSFAIRLNYVAATVVVLTTTGTAQSPRTEKTASGSECRPWASSKPRRKCSRRASAPRRFPFAVCQRFITRFRLELDIGRIVLHDPVEIFIIPCLYPLPCGRTDFGNREGHACLPRARRTKAGIFARLAELFFEAGEIRKRPTTGDGIV